MSRSTKLFVHIMMVFFLLSLTGFSQLQAEETVKCAVTGKEIKKSDAAGSMEYKGKTYYFCCAGCEAKFKKNPEEYINRLGQSELMQSDYMCAEHAAEVVDPVCGKKIKKDEARYSYEYKGKTYYFCMEGCREKFVENPEKYLKTDDEMVTCPVSGEDIKKSDAAGSMEYKGKTYYFCCAGCKEKFEKNPEQYIKKEDGRSGSERPQTSSEGACCASSIKKK